MSRSSLLIKINVEYHNLRSLLGDLQLFLKTNYPKMQPLNDWENVYLSDQYDFENQSEFSVATKPGTYTRDKTTHDLYCNDQTDVLRMKLFLLSLGTCTINLIALIIASIYRLLKLVSMYECRNKHNANVKNVANWSLDLALLILGPVILLGMQITAMLGTITPKQHGPRDARKMYALGETILFGYDGWRLAPCFRPDPEKHLFGGKVGKLNQW